MELLVYYGNKGLLVKMTFLIFNTTNGGLLF